jgi:hypothetical protein
MKSSKFFIGGIVGGVVHFLLGWVVWGMLLKNFMADHSVKDSTAFRGEDDMMWWAFIVGSLAAGFFFSYLLGKCNARSAGSGAGVAFVAGLLISIAIDCIMYAQLNLWDTTAMAVDIVASTVVSVIIGAIIGWIYGMGSKAAA